MKNRRPRTGGAGEGVDVGPTKTPRRNKREEVLEKAAHLFAHQGFDGTSMRDIASSVGMLHGSLYYHFPSKEDMFVAIHERVVARMTERVETAIAPVEEPWNRVEEAAVAHLTGLLEAGNQVTIISPNFPDEHADLNKQLKAHRNAYEAIFKRLFAEAPARADADPSLLRLQLLGALNWVPVWFDPKRESSPEEIARSFVRIIAESVNPDR